MRHFCKNPILVSSLILPIAPRMKNKRLCKWMEANMSLYSSFAAGSSALKCKEATKSLIQTSSYRVQFLSSPSHLSVCTSLFELRSIPLPKFKNDSLFDSIPFCCFLVFFWWKKVLWSYLSTSFTACSVQSVVIQLLKFVKRVCTVNGLKCSFYWVIL